MRVSERVHPTACPIADLAPPDNSGSWERVRPTADLAPLTIGPPVESQAMQSFLDRSEVEEE